MAFVNVEGEVTRLHGQGNGFGLKESWQSQGSERSRYWAVFPKDAVSVNVGDRVKASGGLQTSVTDPKVNAQGEERRYVDHVVGQAKVEVTQAAQQGAPQAWSSGGSGASAGEWSSPASNAPQTGAQGFGGFPDEEPF